MIRCSRARRSAAAVFILLESSGCADDDGVDDDPEPTQTSRWFIGTRHDVEVGGPSDAFAVRLRRRYDPADGAWDESALWTRDDEEPLWWQSQGTAEDGMWSGAGADIEGAWSGEGTYEGEAPAWIGLHWDGRLDGTGRDGWTIHGDQRSEAGEILRNDEMRDQNGELRNYVEWRSTEVTEADWVAAVADVGGAPPVPE